MSQGYLGEVWRAMDTSAVSSATRNRKSTSNRMALLDSERMSVSSP